MANKTPSTKNIEQALGIGDDLLKNTSPDEEKKKLFKERQEKLKKIQEEMQRKKSNYEHDKEFIKDMYREVAETSMMAVRIMQEEAGMTGDYKNVEALAAAANSVSQALDGLKNVELDEEKLRIEREKVEIKKGVANSILNKQGITGGTVNNIVHVGSTGDLIRSLKQLEKEDKEKTIDATVEIVEEKDKV